MKPDSTNIRKLTKSAGVRISPSFSKDRNKIVYFKGSTCKNCRNGVSYFDIFEFDLEANIETRITNYKFHIPGKIEYFKNNNSYIFSAEEPSSVNANPKFIKDFYRKVVNENKIFSYENGNIYKFDLGAGLKKAYTSTFLDISQDSSTILFYSKTNRMDGSKKKKYKYDLFIKDEGNVRRLTRLYGQIHGAAISPN